MTAEPNPSEHHERLYEAYFTETLKADTTARENAERAFAVASAVAAALVAAGVFAKVAQRPWETKLLGLIALVAWLGAAYAFMRTVAHPNFPLVPPTVPKEAWGDSAVEQALIARREVYDKLRRARQLTIVAGLATIGTLGFVLLGRSGEATMATLALSREGQQAVRDLCPQVGPLAGRVQLNALGAKYISVKISEQQCGNTRRTLRIRNRDVIAVKTP